MKVFFQLDLFYHLGWWRRGRCKMEIIRFRKIFLISSTCRHFRSGDQWEADILEEGARPLSWEGWDRGDYKVGKQGNGIALWLWRLSKSLIYQKQNLMYSASKLEGQDPRPKWYPLFFRASPSFTSTFVPWRREGSPGWWWPTGRTLHSPRGLSCPVWSLEQ